MQRESSNSGASLWALLLLSALGSACSEQSVTVELRSLQASGEVTYVCRTTEGEGVPLSECNVGAVFRSQRDLYALVTQTSSGEVAVINVPLDPSDKRPGEGVVDLDPATPGYGFLHVGARPGDIVSTPDGRASFVATGEPGRPALYGLPTSCLDAAAEGESPRDLTTWPACSLPGLPGDIAVVVERGSAAGCDRSLAEEPSLRIECAVSLTDPPESAKDPAPELRKLIVALPDRGTLAVIDAQWLLNRPEGSFEPCKIQAELPLRVDLPSTPISQKLPPDLEACVPSPLPVAPPPPAFEARPAGFAISERKLYVGDSAAPVIHVLNLENLCAMQEEPPLLPRSYENPARAVTTSKVSVSPLTPSGKRFLYAIDEFDWPASSVMAFDVSAGSSERTPIVRPGAPLLPFEAPDRIQINGSAKDVTFVLRDRPQVDPATGNIAIGVACEPDPTRSADAGARYRASADYTQGAHPSQLRGVFAMVLATNGQVSVIDVEDFDAPCRRPLFSNPLPEEDFRGCANDPELPPRGDAGARIFADDLGPTVTQEVSCRMVQPHRARAAALAITSDSVGVRAPSLASFPQFRGPQTPGSSTQTPGTPFAERPKLLAVDFPGVGDQESVPASVYVGTTRYDPGSLRNALVLDPSQADRYSLTLPYYEPRAYLPNEDRSLTYEGALVRDLSSGLLQFDPTTGELRLIDPAVGFCDLGVNDRQLTAELGEERFAQTGDALSRFADDHSDYVVITGDFPEADDAYWSGSMARCGADRALCLAEFQSFDATELAATREFRIRDAQQQVLLLEARGETDPARAVERAQLLECCFPEGISYTVRASRQWVLRGPSGAFRHDVVAAWQKDANGADVLECARDCNPRKRYFDSRVFEISGCTEPTNADQPELCGVGPAEPGDVCVISGRDGPVRLNEAAARCIHHTPTARFAVYRGNSPSLRDMAFSWRTIGGFSTLRMDLGVLSVAVAPQSIVGLPGFDWLTVVDSSSLGLTILDLNSLTALTPTLN